MGLRQEAGVDGTRTTPRAVRWGGCTCTFPRRRRSVRTSTTESRLRCATRDLENNNNVCVWAGGVPRDTCAQAGGRAGQAPSLLPARLRRIPCARPAVAGRLAGTAGVFRVRGGRVLRMRREDRAGRGLSRPTAVGLAQREGRHQGAVIRAAAAGSFSSPWGPRAAPRLASQPAHDRTRGGAGHVDAAADQNRIAALAFLKLAVQNQPRAVGTGGESATLTQ